MATIEQFQGRLRLAIREELKKILAAGDLPQAEAGEAKFTTIETLALAAGDAVSLEVFEQQLAESGVGPPHCPRWRLRGKAVSSSTTGLCKPGVVWMCAKLSEHRGSTVRLSPGFFSLSPKPWVWTWTITIVRQP